MGLKRIIDNTVLGTSTILTLGAVGTTRSLSGIVYNDRKAYQMDEKISKCIEEDNLKPNEKIISDMLEERHKYIKNMKGSIYVGMGSLFLLYIGLGKLLF